MRRSIKNIIQFLVTHFKYSTVKRQKNAQNDGGIDLSIAAAWPRIFSLKVLYWTVLYVPQTLCERLGRP